MLALALAVGALATSGGNDSGLATRLPPTPLKLWDVAWSRTLVAPGILEWKPQELAGPAVDPISGIVVVGTRDARITALDPQGRTLWDFKTSGRFSAPARMEGDLVLAGCDDGRLYALEIATGKERWRYDAHEEVGTTPIVSGGVAYVSTLEDTLLALDAQTGAWKWHHRREGTGGFTVRGAAQAVVRDGTVYTAYSDGTVAALDAKTGAVRWERKVAPSGDVVDVDSIQLKGEQLYAAAYSGAVVALDPATGRTVWETKVPGALRVGAGDGFLISVSTTAVSALSPRDGSAQWTIRIPGVPSGEPVVLGGRVLVPVGTALLWLDAATGRTIAALDPGTGISATPAVAGRRMYVLSNAGELVALDLR